MWENGNLTGPTYDETMQQNAKAIGEVKTLKWLQEMDFEQFKGEIEDAE